MVLSANRLSLEARSRPRQPLTRPWTSSNSEVAVNQAWNSTTAGAKVTSGYCQNQLSWTVSGYRPDIEELQLWTLSSRQWRWPCRKWTVAMSLFEALGCRLDADSSRDDDFRIVQLLGR